MEVISIEEKSFYELLDKIFEEFETKYGRQEKHWIDEQEAMQLLGIRSKTTLQQLRDTDAIKFTQPRKKLILYYRQSLLDWLEKHSNK